LASFSTIYLQFGIGLIFGASLNKLYSCRSLLIFPDFFHAVSQK